MDSNINLKRLNTDNLGEYYQLLEMFARAFEDDASYLSTQPSHEYARNLLANPDFFAIVAINDGIIAGALCGYILHKFEQERSEAYIYDLAVDEKFRQKGIATKLIEETKIISREKGAWTIYVQADYGDTPAFNLYNKLGVKEEVLHFDIAVD